MFKAHRGSVEKGNCFVARVLKQLVSYFIYSLILLYQVISLRHGVIKH